MQNISRYNAMRTRIREYEAQKGTVVELEAEVNKVCTLFLCSLCSNAFSIPSTTEH